MALIIGVFEQEAEMEEAVDRLEAEGYSADHIKVIHYTHADNDFSSTVRDDATGYLVGMGTMSVPDLGIIASAGPISEIMSGNTVSGFNGILLNNKLDEDTHEWYQREIQNGRVVLEMKETKENARRVGELLEKAGAKEVRVQ